MIIKERCRHIKNVLKKDKDNLDQLGQYDFISGCSSQNYLAFGSSVKSIGKETFSDCTAMTKLISYAAVPPICGSQALDDINKWNSSLSVPQGMTSAYQQADQWKEFFFISDDATGIVNTMNVEPVQIGVYNLNGTKLQEQHRGVNLIRMSDGTTKKIIVK